MVLDSVLSNVDEVLSINPSANILVFGDFNVHHKDWLTYYSGTDRSGELFLSQTILLRWLTFLLTSKTDSHSPALLGFFLSSDASICSTVAFPLGNSDHVVVSYSIDFPSYSQQDPLFHRIPYDYYCANWDSLCDHFRYVLWEDIFKLNASAAAGEFFEWVQVGIDVYILNRKYQLKPHSS